MVTRGIAAFLGAFALINWIGSFLVAGFDANIWWIRLTPLPGWMSSGLVALAGIVLLAQSVGSLRRAWLRRVGAAVLAVVAGFALANAIEFYALAARGKILAWVPIPLSAIVLIALAWIAVSMLREQKRSNCASGYVVAAVTIGALILGFPVAQMLFFGTTDYRRKADVAVVLGARTYSDGTASQALHDRVRTAVELYQQGWVTRLIFSGGPGDGAISEPQAMRQIAIDRGVPENAIALDERGLNTQATVTNTVAAFQDMKVHRVLVVSHAYHLPRVKLAYQRAGWDVRTVPARQSRRLRNEVFYVGREVAAIWAYYLRPVI